MNRMVAPILAAGLLAGCGWQFPPMQQAAQPAPAPQVVIVREPGETVVRHVYHEVPTPVVVQPTVQVQSEPERVVVHETHVVRHRPYRPHRPRCAPFVRIICPPRRPAPRGRHGPGYRPPPPPPHNRRRGPSPPPGNRGREQPPPTVKPRQPDPPSNRGVRVRKPVFQEADRPDRTGRG